MKRNIAPSPIFPSAQASDGPSQDPPGELRPLEIVLIHTPAGKRYGRDDYVAAGCSMRLDAAMYLLERGVRVTGTDACSEDAPFVHTPEKYERSRMPR